MNCKRCECPITKKTRRVVVRELHYLQRVKAVYCRHCYKAITGKKRITDCLEMDIINAGGDLNNGS
jgi:hypothetical protein